MNFLAVIPARYASTRFPGKPLALIGGVPMIQRVYSRVCESYADAIVATDDQRIADAVAAFGGRCVMTSSFHRSGTDRAAEALGIYEDMTGVRFDVVVNVQGDEPFVSREHLEGIRVPFSSPQTQIATLVKRFSDNEDIFNPNSPKVLVSRSGEALCFSRSAIPHLRGVDPSQWQSRRVYWKHIGLYAYRSDVLREITALPPGDLETAESLEQLRWLENGYRIRVVETFSENVAVDTPDDLRRVNESLGNL